jgi:hypothetical protein
VSPCSLSSTSSARHTIRIHESPNPNTDEDPDEVEDVISDAREKNNPVTREEEQRPEPRPEQPNAAREQAGANAASNADKESQAAAESAQRLTRRASPIERLEPTPIGQLCVQAKDRLVLSDSERERRSWNAVTVQSHGQKQEWITHAPGRALNILRSLSVWSPMSGTS